MPLFECEVEDSSGARREFTVEADDLYDAQEEVDSKMSRYCRDYDILRLYEIG